MGSECNTNGGRYDLTKSRRTRKPPMVLTMTSPDQGADQEGRIPSKVIEGKEGAVDRRTLKDLMDSEGGKKHDGNVGYHSNSLGHHFMEEKKNLALATKQGVCSDEAKLSGMVGHYIKVLNHLIKVKRDPQLGHRKRAIVRLLT